MKDIKQYADEQLIEHIRTVDQEAYLEIVLRYQGRLLRYAFGLVHDEAKAADVVQSAFIKAFVNLRGFAIQKKFSAWIYRIVHNEAMSMLTRQKQELPLVDEVEIESSENIEAEFETREIQQRVQHCLTKMPILYSEPLALFFLEEKTYEEISDILRIPIGTVGTRISRAKQLMKRTCQTTLT